MASVKLSAEVATAIRIENEYLENVGPFDDWSGIDDDDTGDDE